jgi:hypothetical protein
VLVVIVLVVIVLGWSQFGLVVLVIMRVAHASTIYPWGVPGNRWDRPKTAHSCIKEDNFHSLARNAPRGPILRG